MLMLLCNSVPGNKQIHRQRQLPDSSPDSGSGSGGVEDKDSVSWVFPFSS